MTLIRLKQKYTRNARHWKQNPRGAMAGDNPSSNPNVRRRSRLGMTPRRTWGRGEGKGAVKARED